MRTAGKRPKALWARRIRTRDSRFVPTLTDRPQPAPWTVPSASLSARKHAACGDFQEPLPARPDRCLCKKIFFSRSAGCPVAPLLPCLLSRKDGTSTPVVSSLSRYASPGAGSPCVPSCPCFPSSYKGMDLPAPHPGNRLPSTQKTSPDDRPVTTFPPQLQYPVPPHGSQQTPTPHTGAPRPQRARCGRR